MKFKLDFSAVVVVALLGVVLSTAIFLEIRNSALEQFSVIFQKQAKDRTVAVSGKLGRHLLEMEGLRRFYEQSDEVTGKEFEWYAKPMLRDSCVQSIEWIPRVRQDGRTAFEARTGIRIREQDADDRLVPARERAEYFPIELAEPFKLNGPALGFDLGSNPERLAALEAAWDQGETSAMELVRLEESPTNPPVFMLMAPVYRQPSETLEERRRNLNGFVLGMYRMDGLVMHAMEKVSAQGLAFMLEDLDAAPGNRLLYRHDPQIGTFDWDRAPDALWKHEELINGAGHNWRMTVFPNDVFIRTYLSSFYWWNLPVGMLLTLFMAMLVRMQLHGRLNAELLVLERTVDLRESEEKFRRLAENSPDMIYRMSLPDRCYEYVSPASTGMFGYSPEKFLD
ncbi:MAG: CHASE domain-containing protein, partial [Verrucomicrobia bacterium]|nr:CHASE domain-containing protein [Verrucomicrobiota bacterium]